MQNDFEKNISQRMQEFSITPQPEVWQQVEAGLPPKKKRRFALWWLFPLALLLGTSIYLVTKYFATTSSKQTENNVSKSQPKSASKNATATTQTISEDSVFTITRPSLSNHLFTDTAIPVQAQSSVVYKKPIATQTQIAQPEKYVAAVPYNANRNSHAKENAPQPLVANQLTNEAGNNSTTKNTHDSITSSTFNTSQTEDSTSLKNTPTSILSSSNPRLADSLQLKTMAKDTPATSSKPANSTALRSRTPGAIGKKNKIEWRLQAGLGKSDIDGDNYKYVSSNYQSASPVTGPALSNGGGSFLANSFLRAQTGLSFSAGITRRQYLTAHWSWQLSLRYQLLSSTQATGTPLNTNQRGDSNHVNRSYSTGSSITRYSYTHQVIVLPHIGYTLRANAALSVTLYAGFAAGYNFNSNQILNDYRTNTYIRSRYYTNKWYAALDGGLEVSWRKKVYAGFQYQQSVTNIAKPALGSDFRWQHWQAYIGLPLFNHSAK